MALVVLGIVITCCYTEVQSVIQPYTATVHKTIPITLSVKLHNNGNPYKMVVAVLLPNGWAGSKNLTMDYTSDQGDKGTYVLMPSTTTEPSTKGLYNWPTSLLKTFGVVNNYISDMQWVVFQSDKEYTFNKEITVTVNMQLTVGADGINTNCMLAYFIGESQDGLHAIDGYIDNPHPYEYYQMYPAPPDPLKPNDPLGKIGCMVVTGGEGLEDFCHPQLATADPFKSQTDDFITVDFNGYLGQTLLFNQPVVYLHATAFDEAGNKYIVNTQTDNNKMNPVATNKYERTIWPRQFFGVPKGVSLKTMEYTFTDAGGNKVTGLNGTPTPFQYVFRCGE